MMIWSEQELAAMPSNGEKMITEKVLPELDKLENQDIFLPNNFSLLWGILGVTGVANTPVSVRMKIWNALKENGVFEAFQNGRLADFSRQMEKKFHDERLRAWTGEDNYTAETKFCRLILDELLVSNPDLSADVFELGYQPWNLLEKLNAQEMTPALKIFLEEVRKQPQSQGLEEDEYVSRYQKFLRQLVFVIAHTNRFLTEAEKRYFIFCFQDVLWNGFDRHGIGLNDHLWAKLMLRKNMNALSEIERTALRSHNQDVMEVISSFEEEDGFYEECAAQSVYGDDRHCGTLTERCIYLAKKTKNPTGVVYAKALINIGKIRSAVMILQTLAQSGQATMMVSYLDGLLASAPGAENVFLHILKANLFMVRNNSVNYLNSGYMEYIARLYLQAVKAFINNAKYVQAASLLQEMVAEGCFGDNDDMKIEFIYQANEILQKEKDCDGLISAAKRLNLKYFLKNGMRYIGFNEGMILSDELKMINARLFDFTFDSGSRKKQKQPQFANENVKDLPEVKETIPAIINDEKTIKDNVLNIDVKDIDEHFEKIKQTVDASILGETGLANQVDDEIKKSDYEVPQTFAENESESDGRDEDDSRYKVNINNILKINSKDVDEYFDHIKQATNSMFKTVEKKADFIKESIIEKCAVDKFKQFIDRIKMLRKK